MPADPGHKFHGLIRIQEGPQPVPLSLTPSTAFRFANHLPSPHSRISPTGLQALPPFPRFRRPQRTYPGGVQRSMMTNMHRAPCTSRFALPQSFLLTTVPHRIVQLAREYCPHTLYSWLQEYAKDFGQVYDTHEVFNEMSVSFVRWSGFFLSVIRFLFVNVPLLSLLLACRSLLSCLV